MGVIKLFTAFWIAISIIFPIFNQSTRQADVKFKGYSSSYKDLIIIHKKKCPGQIDGECIRTLSYASDKYPAFSNFKKAVYHLKSEEIIILFDELGINRFLINIGYNDEFLHSLMSLLDNEQCYTNIDLKDHIFKQRGKSKIHVVSLEGAELLIFEIPAVKYNKIFNRRIIIDSSEESIQVALLFNNQIIEKLKDLNWNL